MSISVGLEGSTAVTAAQLNRAPNDFDDRRLCGSLKAQPVYGLYWLIRLHEDLR
jgi:hypothetical protein